MPITPASSIATTRRTNHTGSAPFRHYRTVFRCWTPTTAALVRAYRVNAGDIVGRGPPRRVWQVRSLLVVGGDHVGEDVEVAEMLPIVAVADDVDAAFGAGGGHVEEVGFLGGPVARPGAAGFAAQNEDHDVSLLPLHGVDGTDVLVDEVPDPLVAAESLGD